MQCSCPSTMQGAANVVHFWQLLLMTSSLLQAPSSRGSKRTQQGRLQMQQQKLLPQPIQRKWNWIWMKQRKLRRQPLLQQLRLHPLRENLGCRRRQCQLLCLAPLAAQSRTRWAHWTDSRKGRHDMLSTNFAINHEILRLQPHTSSQKLASSKSIFTVHCHVPALLCMPPIRSELCRRDARAQHAASLFWSCDCREMSTIGFRQAGRACL